MQEEIISKSAAARLRGCSRERVRQKVESGLLRTGVAANGRRGVYKSDVMEWKQGKHGRPRLSEEEKIARNRGNIFRVGEKVHWRHEPRDGYGFAVETEAKVLKIGNKRVRIEFHNGSNELTKLWTHPSKLDKIIK